MRRQLITGAFATGTALAAALAVAAPANAAPADKLDVMSGWSQTSASSQDAFLNAQANQGDWAAYGFDWSTDKCSSSPDNPFGFPFENACVRHDFGYRNYKDVGQFEANKPRLDNAFHADLKRVCNTYSGAQKTACDSLAWTYYQAVSNLGLSAADVSVQTGKPVQVAQPTS
ncbi:phospholipase [Streptomyces oceani]|uniref:Phospholipase n=1 Tax=Streptomyces oceani TaxID=1075402 RepID=A0A1E7KH86_9ACTN|nr:phospholipase [Streptomyces oceani]OEV03307.1 hypothetical protein AN216_12230 [Streptomyces oceani]